MCKIDVGDICVKGRMSTLDVGGWLTHSRIWHVGKRLAQAQAPNKHTTNQSSVRHAQQTMRLGLQCSHIGRPTKNVHDIFQQHQKCSTSYRSSSQYTYKNICGHKLCPLQNSASIATEGFHPMSLIQHLVYCTFHHNKPISHGRHIRPIRRPPRQEQCSQASLQQSKNMSITRL